MRRTVVPMADSLDEDAEEGGVSSQQMTRSIARATSTSGKRRRRRPSQVGKGTSCCTALVQRVRRLPSAAAGRRKNKKNTSKGPWGLPGVPLRSVSTRKSEVADASQAWAAAVQGSSFVPYMLSEHYMRVARRSLDQQQRFGRFIAGTSDARSIRRKESVSDTVEACLEPFSFSRFSVSMLADISGFTRLSERYCDRGAEGVEMLSTTLNRFFTRLIDEVEACGGDIMKVRV